MPEHTGPLLMPTRMRSGCPVLGSRTQAAARIMPTPNATRSDAWLGVSCSSPVAAMSAKRKCKLQCDDLLVRGLLRISGMRVHARSTLHSCQPSHRAVDGDNRRSCQPVPPTQHATAWAPLPRHSHASPMVSTLYTARGPSISS